MRCTPLTCRLEIVQQTSRLEDLREVPQPVMTSKPLKTRVITPVFPLLTGHPEKLLLISTGDLSNPALASHFLPLIAELGNYPTVRVPIPSPPAVSAETKFADRRVLGVAAGCGGQPCTT